MPNKYPQPCPKICLAGVAPRTEQKCPSWMSICAMPPKKRLDSGITFGFVCVRRTAETHTSETPLKHTCETFPRTKTHELMHGFEKLRVPFAFVDPPDLSEVDMVFHLVRAIQVKLGFLLILNNLGICDPTRRRWTQSNALWLCGLLLK